MHTENTLLSEGAWLFIKLFNRPAHDELLGRYIDAHKALGITEDAALSKKICAMMANDADIVAAEYAFRRKKIHRNLTKKFQILYYLAETSPEYHALFEATESSPLLTSLKLGKLFVNMGYSFVKGEYLAKRYSA